MLSAMLSEDILKKNSFGSNVISSILFWFMEGMFEEIDENVNGRVLPFWKDAIWFFERRKDVMRPACGDIFWLMKSIMNCVFISESICW